jgi:phosphoribosyl 1,2-cyclic phosphodiesterase
MKIKPIASGSSGNAYVVSDGKTSLLLEAGIPLSKIKRGCNYNLSNISAALITHEHGDHAKSAQSLIDAGVDVYMTEGTAKAIGVNGYRLHTWESYGKDDSRSYSRLQIGSFMVRPFPSHHDAIEPVFYIIRSTETDECLLFITDSYYIDYTFKHYGVTHLMIEANFSDEELDNAVRDGRTPQGLAPRLYRSHMSIETCLKTIKANKSPELKEVWLLHLSGNNANAEDFKRQAQECAGCEVYVA